MVVIKATLRVIMLVHIQEHLVRRSLEYTTSRSLLFTRVCIQVFTPVRIRAHSLTHTLAHRAVHLLVGTTKTLLGGTYKLFFVVAQPVNKTQTENKKRFILPYRKFLFAFYTIRSSRHFLDCIRDIMSNFQLRF